jgi:hypothetical protein
MFINFSILNTIYKTIKIIHLSDTCLNKMCVEIFTFLNIEDKQI